ncbi:outer membrane receptor protein involved in Fe transport [Novosphingobium hassiacum]|uniref:Outer membrane receptor protein involved in Fe transport n=2 Tax=Novosphingobium hassiacum TaxID=173676 RepID=A0A7W5ZWF3_9SPHN|nr:outer membrane receptor protein involved in Fe transport [Novosphingobium hassiacum]
MLRLASTLLLSTALLTPAQAWAQDAAQSAAPDAAPAIAQGAPAQTAEEAATATAPDSAAPQEEATEISIPGGEIVVTGNRDRNIQRAAPQVVSILGAAEIARTGEGNIAGALGRVTGLSVVGNGYVYVRGLGDRYSLALLNGSPLPSPEPLKRVVPLDLFPASIIASSLVQKSYSVNYPGEFGGGVINLTTRSTPDEPFISIGGGISVDTETTNQLGYTFYGSSTDWTGFDNGQRDLTGALQSFFASGARLSSGTVDSAEVAKGIVNTRNGLTQRIPNMPPNFTGTLSAGKTFDLGGATLGVIATAGYNNKWTTRDALTQTSVDSDLADLQSDFRRVTTDNRIVVNGMLGLGLEFGRNKIRWTNLYIRDSLKHTRVSLGQRNQTTVDYQQQDTAWYERQLIDTQIVAELKPFDGVSVDLRGGYANSQREAPYELSFEYVRTNVASDPLGQYFVNNLDGNAGRATVSFSDLNEDLWSGGADISYKIIPTVTATVGYAYTDTRRTSSRRDFQFRAVDLPDGVNLFRPDYLLSNAVIEAFNINLIDTNEGNPAFLATLRNHAGYGKIDAQLTDTLQLDAGVRYETAKLVVSPIAVFADGLTGASPTSLNNNYWLPAATLTWQFRDDMQLRVNASKTIARPQFRELIYQFYFDPDTNRQYRGNPNLVDSRLTNAEARYEWYFARDQRLSLSGFFKRIDNPIESFVALESDNFITSFANAPTADLYGAEFEAQKYIELDSMGGDFWAARRIAVVANYTYTKSKLKVKEGDQTSYFQAASSRALDYFRNGSPLTGQSEHIANVQLGLEDTDGLSQQTLLLSYASKRVTSRGLLNTGQPDIFADPGFRLDFVARQGFKLFAKELELKFEARNLTGRKNIEYQQLGDKRVEVNSFDVGRTLALSASLKF